MTQALDLSPIIRFVADQRVPDPGAMPSGEKLVMIDSKTKMVLARSPLLFKSRVQYYIVSAADRS